MSKEEYKEMYDIVGAAMEVHNTLGYGMAEPIYQEALSMELELNGIKAEREKPLAVYYKGTEMKKHYVVDFFCQGIIVEVKSVEKLCPEHRAQLFNYLRISHMHRGLLINFGERGLRAERYLYLPDRDDFVLLTKANYKLYIDDL